MYNLLFNNDYLNKEWLDTELPEAFLKIGKSIGANCGIVVLRVKKEEVYEENASFGYEDGGFYYAFMSRNQGHFEKVSKSQLPLIFHAKENKLYYDFTDYAVVSRVHLNHQMLGFILFEFTGEYKDIYSLFTGLLAERLARMYSMNNYEENTKINNKEEKSEITEILLTQIPGLSLNLNKIEKQNLLVIKGPSGIGKKHIAKYIHKKNAQWGDIITVNSIPEQFIKLERALEEWEKMVNGGIIVFDNVNSFSPGQQRVIYEFIQNNPIAKLFFIEKLGVEFEKYKPLWSRLEENSIFIPSINEIANEKKINIINLVFKELTIKHGRLGLVLDESAKSKLLNYEYKENILELKNILEYTIIRTKKDSILDTDLIINERMIQTSFNYEDTEDLNLRRCVDAMERQKILLANKLFSGNQVRMAKALGISRGSLQYKMKQMEL